VAEAASAGLNAIAPAPAVSEPSEEEIVASLQATASASRLSLFLQCRLKFFFRYVERIKKPKTPALHLGAFMRC
jgi:putative RecB family exonuclease